MLNYTYSKKHQKLKQRKKNKGLNLLIGSAAALTVLTIFIQLYTMSIFATKGKEITALEMKKNELVRDNKILSDEIANVQNTILANQKSIELGYVDIDYKNVNYLVVE